MHRVGIIGLGHIASGGSKPGDPYPYTHVGGIRLSKKVELAAVADLSPKARDAFRDTWAAHFPGVTSYESGDAMLESEALDIVGICVRGPHHHAVTMRVIASGTKAIFLEKPPSCSLAEMDEMVAAAHAAAVPITVSYSRHWSPTVTRMAELIQDGLIGEVRSVVGYCECGILSSCSHVADEMCQFAGYGPTAVFARGTIQGEVPEGYEPEPDVGAIMIEFANGATGIHVAADGEYGAFYCDIYGSEGRARAGLHTAPGAWRPGGEAIDLSELGLPEPASVFQVAYDQIADHLDGGPLPACTNGDFVTVHEIGFAAIESIATGRRVEVPNVNRTRKVFANG